MSNRPSLGAHMSIAKGFVQAAQDTFSMGANALQIFLKSPRGRGQTKLTPEEAKLFSAFAKENHVDFVVAHASYLINLAKPLSTDRWALQSLVDDLESMALLKGIGVVLHVGKTLSLSYETAESHLVENLKRALEATAHRSTHIILENMAGQGTEMGHSFEQLASIYTKLGRHQRISFCLDTCHLFAAGYDLTSEAAVKKVMADFDEQIGLEHVTVVHFNDSLKELASKRDRHQNLGDGTIGLQGLKALAHFAVQHGWPMILETPENRKTHLDDLHVLKDLIAH